MATKYDYIICGAGAAGLSLALKLTGEEFNHLGILVIDKEEKKENDHTWCFWEQESSPYDDLLTNSFENINFHSKDFTKNTDINPYRYKMLQSVPFYKFALNKISECRHIEFIVDDVANIEEHGDKVIVSTNNNSFETSYVFSSIIKGSIDKSKYLYVDQHFKGWFIKTPEDFFDPATATFMDFRIDQYGECRFFYVLPTSKREALVEIAIFSNQVMSPKDYDPLIANYIDAFLGGISYEVQEKEYGVIPMTSYPFWNHATARIFPIGTAAGAVKPSSGFAFKRIQEHCDRIQNAILNKENISNTYQPFKNRFYLYDRILLDVILNQSKSGDGIFADLFENNDASLIFKFLDGQTSLREETRIFRTLPLWPFLRGWFRQKLGL